MRSDISRVIGTRGSTERFLAGRSLVIKLPPMPSGISPHTIRPFFRYGFMGLVIMACLGPHPSFSQTPHEDARFKKATYILGRVKIDRKFVSMSGPVKRETETMKG